MYENGGRNKKLKLCDFENKHSSTDTRRYALKRFRTAIKILKQESEARIKYYFASG
jgi:hypothetical protein